MSGLMDKAKGALDNKLNKDAQPGDAVEGRADGATNDSRSTHSTTVLNHHDLVMLGQRPADIYSRG